MRIVISRANRTRGALGIKMNRLWRKIRHPLIERSLKGLKDKTIKPGMETKHIFKIAGGTPGQIGEFAQIMAKRRKRNENWSMAILTEEEFVDRLQRSEMQGKMLGKTLIIGSAVAATGFALFRLYTGIEYVSANTHVGLEALGLVGFMIGVNRITKTSWKTYERKRTLGKLIGSDVFGPSAKGRLEDMRKDHAIEGLDFRMNH